VGCDRAGEGRLRVLGSGVGTGGAGGDSAGGGGDVHDVGRSLGEQAGQERAQAPDAAEVVHAGDELDPLRVPVDETRPRGNACVVDEQPDPGMAFEHRGGDAVDGFTVADVADLRLAADLVRQ